MRRKWLAAIVGLLVPASCMVGQAGAGGTVSSVPAGRPAAGATEATVQEAGANTFQPLAPTRLLDTRAGPPFGPGEVRNLQIIGRDGIPAGAVAVALNLTVTAPTAPGYVSVFPTGTPFAGNSNLNYGPGETVANLVMVGIGAGGQISLRQAGGTAHVIADVQGWFSGGFNPISPVRAVDTRFGQGPLGPGETRTLAIGGRFGIPAGASAVALNLTATAPTAGGWLSVFPGGTPFPGTSNLNFLAGQTVANMVLVGLGSSGRISMLNAVGATHVIVDVAGWFSGGFKPVTPARMADTRAGRCGVRLGQGDRRNIAILARGGVPASGVNAVALNITVTGPTAASYLTVYPKGTPLPGASNLNVARGQTVANLVTSSVGADGAVTVFNAAGTVDLIVDVTGWFEGTSVATPEFDCAVLSPEVPLAPGGSGFPPGTFAVPAQIAPGRYVAPGGATCAWQRHGSAGQVLGTGGGGPRPIIDVAPGDALVSTSGCGTWQAYGPPMAAAAAVGDGDWVVSEEMLPGVYQSSAAAPCRWEQLMAFSGQADDRLDDGIAYGPATVEIAPFEIGFRSHGCGVWRYVGPPVE